MRDDRAVLTIEPGRYPQELAGIRVRLADRSVIALGMIGSTRGSQDASYVPARADFQRVADTRTTVADEDTAIVPGVCLRDGARADVMRGEEVHVLGAVATGRAPPQALSAQLDALNKWIEVREGHVVDSATAMTGELFALFRGHSIIAGMLNRPLADGRAFRDRISRGPV
jgi:2-dehydro-3-deoxygalactonokinase